MAPDSEQPLQPGLRPVDLKRRLLLRVSLFAFGLLLLAAAGTLWQAVHRIDADARHSGLAVQRLLSRQFDDKLAGFAPHPLVLDMTPLSGLGELAAFCLQVDNLYRLPVKHHCFGRSDGGDAATRLLAAQLQRWVGDSADYHAVLQNLLGLKVAELTVSPNYLHEAHVVQQQLGWLLLGTLAVLGVNVLVYRAVARALAPAHQVLQALSRMEAGDLGVRIPAVELVELHRIGQGFNHLAERLQHTMEAQRQLAQHLLQVREDERRHLARELHDEFGQCLASIHGEAAFAGELAHEQLPALTPCVQAIARTTLHMMDVLHTLLRRLRPVGLDEFGLAASLQQLVADWDERARGRSRWRLDLQGDVDGLADNLSVSIYRIVQECLTNAARHGRVNRVDVRLQRLADAVALHIDDDGVAAQAAAEQAPRRRGFGLLGLRERVHALGGTLAIRPGDPAGHHVAVWLPLAPAAQPAPLAWPAA